MRGKRSEITNKYAGIVHSDRHQSWRLTRVSSKPPKSSASSSAHKRTFVPTSAPGQVKRPFSSRLAQTHKPNLRS